MFDRDDLELLELASSSASLDASPKKNWVENSGGLPPYVRKLARGIMKSGKSKSQAIAIAISRIKKWAAGGGDVDADTKAKAAKALAQWTALKAKNKGKSLVKASREDGSDYLMFSGVGSFNTDMVRRAWDAVRAEARRIQRELDRATGVETYDMEPVPYSYVRELWTDFIIVEVEGGPTPRLLKVPYTVSGTHVEFGDPAEVQVTYEETGDDLTDVEMALLADVLVLTNESAQE